MTTELFNPFPGLRAFEPDEDHLFFGREREIDELLRRLRRARFLAVIGGSGSGKSSLVRCGLIPSLYGGMMTHAGSSWRIAILRPGEDPIGNLASALDAKDVLGQEGELGETNSVLLEATLRRGSLGLRDCVRQARIPDRDNVLVFVDQFEELFRFKRSPRIANSHDDAVAFVKLLLDSSGDEGAEDGGRVHVVLTMRSDFIDRCMDYPGLPEAINRSQYLVPRMTRDELRNSITGPVSVGGGDIARRLVVRLLNEVGDDPDQLPVLQHALRRTWSAWEANPDGPIDAAHYESIGTMKEALSRHADEAFADLESDAARTLAERLFKALTDASATGGGVRRPTSVAEASAITGGSTDRIKAVVEIFRRPGRSFLTPPAATPLTDQSILDLSHESLMRGWSRLIEWAGEERLSAASYSRLSRAAARHADGTASFWRDPELSLGLQWRETARPTAAWAGHIDDKFEPAMAFLDASRTARDRGRRNRRLLVGGALAAVVVAASTIGWLGIKAERSAREVRANSLMVVARSTNDPVLTALLVPEVGREPRRGMAELRPLLNDSAIAEYVFRGHQAAITSVACHPDGSLVATGADDGTVLLWPADGSASEIVLAHDGEARTVAFSPDGSRLVVGYRDGTANIWPVPSSGEPVVLRGHTGSIESAEFSSDGSRVVTASLDGTARLWSIAGEALHTLEHRDWVRSAVFDADGSRVLTASADGQARLWGADGALLAEFDHPDRLTSAVFRPGTDGQILTASDDGVARLWPIDGSTGPRAFRDPAGAALSSASFDAEGLHVVTASATHAMFWSVDGSLQGEVLHDRPVRVAKFAPRGAQALIASADGTGRLWSVGQSGGGTLLRGHGADLVAAAYSSDGRQVVTVSADKTARVWSSRGAGEPRTFDAGARSLTGAAYSPTSDSSIVASSIDGTARLWSAEGEPRQVFDHSDWVRSVEFNPQGTAVLTSANDGYARIWPLDGSAEPVTLGQNQERLVSARYSPDGTSVVTLDEAGTAVILPVTGASGGIALPHEGGASWVDFAPDGGSVLSASARGVLRWASDREAAPAQVLSAERVQEVGGGQVTSAAVSPDGRSLLTGSADGRARIWSLAGGSEPRVLDDGEPGAEAKSPVTAVAYSADGSRVAAASQDGVVRVWDLAGDSGPIDFLEHAGNRVNSLEFSADGSTLLTAAADGSARVWRIGWDSLVDYLQNSTRICLTPQQRIGFLGEATDDAAAAFEACESAHGR